MDNQKKHIERLIRQTAFGLVLFEISGAITYLVDGVITGKFLGDVCLASNGITGPVFSILTIITGVLVAGFKIVSGDKIGKGEIEEAQKVWWDTFRFAFVISIVITFIGVACASPLATLLGAGKDQPELHLYSTQYLRGFLIGAVPYIVSAVFIPAVQLNGHNNRITASVAAMTVADIIGDLANVKLFHGGMFGMGLSTSLSYLVSAAVMMTSFYTNESVFTLKLDRSKTDNLKNVFINGQTKVVTRLCNTLRPMFINRIILAVAGSAGIAAMSVETSTRYVVESLGVGISGAVMLLVVIFIGECNAEALRLVKKISLRYVWLGVSGLAVIYFILAPYITLAYLSPQSEAYAMSVMILRCHAVSLPFLAYNELWLNIYQGVGHLKLTNVITVFQRAVYIVALTAILSSVLGHQGLWIAITVSEMLMSLTIVVINRFTRLAEAHFGERVEAEFSSQLSRPDEIGNLLDELDEFLSENSIDETSAHNIRLFYEELVTTIMNNGYDPSEDHYMLIRVLITDHGITLRSTDDFIRLSAKEFTYVSGYEDVEWTDDIDCFIGIKIILALAKDMKYLNTMKTNNLIIKI